MMLLSEPLDAAGLPAYSPHTPDSLCPIGTRSCFSSVTVAFRLPGLPNSAGLEHLGAGLAGSSPLEDGLATRCYSSG